MSIAIKLQRADRTYRPGERVEGVVVVKSPTPMMHQGLTLVATGTANPHGVYDGSLGGDATSSAHATTLMRHEIQVASPGRFPAGSIDIPFEAPVVSVDGTREHPAGRPADLAAAGAAAGGGGRASGKVLGTQLRESYNGVYVSIKYTVVAFLKRGGFNKPIQTGLEFFVEVPAETPPEAGMMEFQFTPEGLANVADASAKRLPKFRITGRFDQTACSLSRPFTGSITVEESELAVRSIELQLVRVETLDLSTRKGRESTEIQNLQLAEGNVTRGLAIPMYMIFPRRFSCPSTSGDNFAVAFEVNVIVAFENKFIVTENFPITLYRGR